MAELDQKLEEMEGFSEDIREYVVGGKVWSGVSAKWEFKEWVLLVVFSVDGSNGHLCP